MLYRYKCLFSHIARADVGERALFGQFGADRITVVGAIGHQRRLWPSSLAYVLVSPVCRIGPAGTELEPATCGSDRIRARGSTDGKHD